MNSKRVLRDYFIKYWPVYVLAFLTIGIANLFQSYYPRLLGHFTDDLQQGKITRHLIVIYSLKLLGVGLVFGVLGAVGQYVIMRLGRYFEFVLRRALFQHFTALSESFYAKQGVGRLLSYMMNDVTAVREAISRGLTLITNATILIVSTIIMMLFSSIPVTVIAVCNLPLLAIPWVVTRFGPVVRDRSLKVQEALGNMTESAEEQFGGIRVTKKFAVESIMAARFGETVDRIRDHQIRLVRMSSLFQALIPLIGSLSLVVTLIFGGYWTTQGKISLGQFVALTLYIRMMINPLQQIGNVINMIQRSRASLERINNLLGLQPDIKEEECASSIDFANAPITIRNLSFAYPDALNEALHNIDWSIQPGQTVGIVGKTGSGKSTLIRLLLRIYDPPRGTVRIGGSDIRDLTMECLRSQIAYVPQDGFLFSTTIRDNIAFHQRDIELDSVEYAAMQAEIYDSINLMPDKFETKLGERGITLSGGQRQRTSLARGLIKNAPVMILDDGVSAVDAVTEKRIINTIRAERKNKTTILIAHRISTLMHADDIIVLDQGRIAQRGTHKELLAQEGIYAELYAIQKGGMEDHGTDYEDGAAV